IVILGVPIVAGLLVVIFFVAYLVAWLDAGPWLYSGDGHYRKGVDGSAFQVELPAIDLSHPGHYRYQFTHLWPPNGHAVGLRCDPPYPSQAVVGITLRDQRGRIIFSGQRLLRDWTWTRNMATLDVSRFESRWSERYELTIDVIESVPSPRTIRPVIEG